MKVPALLSTLVLTTTMSASSQLIYLGTYTPKNGASRGIYSVRLDLVTGTLTAPVLAAETPNPTFLALNPDGGRLLYAVDESSGTGGERQGVVSAFAIDPEHGTLVRLNSESTGGASLAHVATDATGRMLIAASYGGGYAASFPLAADGRLLPRATFLADEGPLGPNPARQEKPHAHSTTFSPDNRFAFVADLGLDRVFSYRIDPAHGTFRPNDPAFVTITPGAGPRHCRFSNDGRQFYVLGEIDGSITACAYDAARGVAVPIQHISTLPAGFKVTDPDRAAEIRVHPNGNFIYASNRGHDSLAVFARNPADGRLTLVEIVPCGGAHPRNFALSSDGSWLVCANRDSNNLAVFRVDPATGRLTATGQSVTVPQAVCVLFVPGAR
jgi:6-phosphogluconolactonase